MATLHINLTDQERDSLLTIARQTGKSQDELLRDAINDALVKSLQSSELADTPSLWHNDLQGWRPLIWARFGLFTRPSSMGVTGHARL